MKHILTALLFVLFGCTCNAQIVKSVGIKGGISIANQIWYSSAEYTTKYSIDKNDKKSRGGKYFAISGELNILKHFSLVSDLGYCEKVVEYDYDYYNLDPVSYPYNALRHNKFSVIANYFEFETAGKYIFNVKNLGIYSLLGLQVNYLHSATLPDYLLRDFDKYGHKFGWGLIAGFGTQYKIKQLGFNLEALYKYDVSTFIRYDNSYYEVNNTTLILNGGINYYFKKKVK